MVAAIATIGALLPTTFYAGPQNQNPTLSETLGVAFLVVFRVGPGVAILWTTLIYGSVSLSAMSGSLAGSRWPRTEAATRQAGSKRRG